MVPRLCRASPYQTWRDYCSAKGLEGKRVAGRSNLTRQAGTLSYNLLAKPRIEVETAGIFNFDFAEIVMFRIKEKCSLSRHNHTRNGKNQEVTRANPIVANIF